MRTLVLSGDNVNVSTVSSPSVLASASSTVGTSRPCFPVIEESHSRRLIPSTKSIT